MKINWKVRFGSKKFWLTFFPALFLLIEQVAAIFGYTLDFSVLSEQVLEVINTIFVILAIVGVVVDPTTSGISDSERALNYVKPGRLPEHMKE